ncbi:MAG TPA: hypothetical protein VKA50_05370 [Gammaproteobacteria bacterium]|nr:hypothetical protein [Gammaproteobacteria bacterium]
MKRCISILAMSALCAGMAQAGPLVTPQVQLNPKVQTQPQLNPKLNPKLRPQLHIQTGCPDPALRRVSVYIVQSLSNGSKRINFMVQLHNNGRMNYHTLPRGAMIHMYTKPLGGGAPRRLDDHYFQNLRAGSGINYFSHYLNWSQSVEFPPNLVVEIRYLDPEYGSDATRANDDCNMRNNRFVLRGSDINRQIAAKAR